MIGDLLLWYETMILSFTTNFFVNIEFLLSEDMIVAVVIVI